MKKKYGFCVSCKTRKSNTFEPMKDKWKQFKYFKTPPKVKQNMFCAKCSKGIWVGLANNQPIMKPTSEKIGNRLFAQHDYKKNEIVTYYSGNVHKFNTKAELDNFIWTNDTTYMYQPKKLTIIDGKFNFAKGKGRYINTAPEGIKNNVKWGQHLNGQAAIRTIRHINKGEQFFIDYGDEYFTNRNKH